MPKTAVGALALTVAEFAFMLRFIYDPKYLIIVWVAEKLILIPLVIYSAVNLRKLQKAGKAVAEGNLEYKTDTRSLFGDFKRFGEDMNRISDGMSAEVEKRTHSDRMKTELITNVSHDLKTPLTSLVNYSDLICAEKCDNEKYPNTPKSFTVSPCVSNALSTILSKPQKPRAARLMSALLPATFQHSSIRSRANTATVSLPPNWNPLYVCRPNPFTSLPTRADCSACSTIF